MQIPTPNPDVFETQCWAYHIISHPQELLTEGFDYATPGRFRKYIQWTLQAAAEPRICTKEEPGQLMAAFQVINSVMLAAEALLQQHQAGEEHLLVSHDPCGAKLRLLGRKDRADPYRVFRRFFKYQSTSLWKQDLNRALGYALSRAAVDDTMNLLPLYWHVTCLIEAAWVVQERAKAAVKPAAALQSA
ncbi:hypothetical protein ACTJIJ_24510 [Niabella sp. 22666]|uniref:hypothetical protein n=1 Tax=Niabella sp. 22666 TaxID=3453954 RepID=UPI003F86C36B